MKKYTSRRNLLKFIAGFLIVLMAGPACALDLFKVIDPEGKNKDLQKAKKILKGAGNIAASATDIDYNSEFAIGESLALEGFSRYGLPVENEMLQNYVNLVGNTVAKYSNRSGIPYYFVVVDSPLYNAFACPGGIIFISSALVKMMEDESQLAAVLAHEVGHVMHKHALKSIKRAKFFEGVGQITAATVKGEHAAEYQEMIGSLQTVLFDKGLDKEMEYEADIAGMEIAYNTGYDPGGFVKVLEMLAENEKKSPNKGWFSTHPPLTSRIEKCRAKMKEFPDAASLAKVKTRFASSTEGL